MLVLSVCLGCCKNNHYFSFFKTMHRKNDSFRSLGHGAVECPMVINNLFIKIVDLHKLIQPFLIYDKVVSFLQFLDINTEDVILDRK